LKPRIASFRTWLLVAMLVAGGLGLLGARFAIGRIQQNEEETGDRVKDQQIARAIAEEVVAGADVDQFEAIQSVLPYDQVLVYRDGRQIYAGPAIRDTAFELGVVAPFPGGRVVLRDYNTPEAGWSLEVTLVVVGLVLVVIAAALLAASVLTRALRHPINRAVATADRVAEGDLEARIGELVPEELDRLARAFDSMAARLESADHEQREFLADVVHEIATPMNAIAGLAGALADGTIETAGEREAANELIETQSARLAALLEDLRRLTRLDLAESVSPEIVDLHEVSRSLQIRFGRAASEAELRLSVSAEPRSLVTDRRLLDTILDNLVSNAIRYTPAGGSVEVSVMRRNGVLEFVVADTGIGIDRADAERIFERFYRVASARDRASGGSGLGLALARSAANALGGRIDVVTEVGRGSRFRLLLPDVHHSSPPELDLSPTRGRGVTAS
jgi:signal transduction histidine kinase